MKFITKQQLLDAGTPVVTEIFNWWKPEAGDLVVIGEDEVGDVVVKTTDSGLVECIWDNFRLDDTDSQGTFPLLTVGQLIEFLEYKLDEPIDIFRTEKSGQSIATEWIDGVGECWFDVHTETKDILLALWECVVKVCTDSKYATK